MEIFIYVLLAIALMLLLYRFRKQDIPEGVRKNFRNSYKEATNYEWIRHPDYYEVTFYHENVEKKAKYDREGFWIETKTHVVKQELPEHVKFMVEEKFQAFKLEDISYVKNNRNQAFYKLVIDTGDVNYLLKVNFNGTLLQMRNLTKDKLRAKFDKDKPEN